MLPKDENDILTIDEEFDGGSGAAKGNGQAADPGFKIFTGHYNEKENPSDDDDSDGNESSSEKEKKDKSGGPKYNQAKQEKLARLNAEIEIKSIDLLVSSSMQMIFFKRNQDDIRRRFSLDPKATEALIELKTQVYILEGTVKNPNSQFWKAFAFAYIPMLVLMIRLIFFEKPIEPAAPNNANQRQPGPDPGPGGPGTQDPPPGGNGFQKAQPNNPGTGKNWEYVDYTEIKDDGKSQAQHNGNGVGEGQKKKGPGRPDGVRKHPITGEFVQFIWDATKNEWIPPKV